MNTNNYTPNYDTSKFSSIPDETLNKTTQSQKNDVVEKPQMRGRAYAIIKTGNQENQIFKTAEKEIGESYKNIKQESLLEKNVLPITSKNVKKDLFTFVGKLFHIGSFASENEEISTYRPKPSAKNEMKTNEKLNEQLLDNSDAGLKLKNALGDIKNTPPTELFKLSEDLAKKYIESKDFTKATQVRIMVSEHFKANSPLNNLKEVVAEIKNPLLGTSISGLDSTVIKNHTVSIQYRSLEDNKKMLHMEAELLMPHREALGETISLIQKDPKQFLKCLPKGFCSEVTVTTTGKDVYLQRKGENFSLQEKEGFSFSNAHVIHFKGIGKITVGGEKDVHCHYRRLVIDLDPKISSEEASEKLNIMLSSVGLGGVSAGSGEVDQERTKIMQLFHASYPKEAHALEKNAATYEMSLETLKETITKAVPEMHNKLEVDLPLMYKQEISQGRDIWCVKGIADKSREQGAVGLFSGIGGSGGATLESASESLARILQDGQISSLNRFSNGLFKQGASSKNDLELGGGDAIFTRVFTKKMEENEAKIKFFRFSGHIQILYDLELMERTNTYGYENDQFGTKGKGIDRTTEVYSTRKNMVNLTNDVNSKFDNKSSNEVCISKRVDPKHIKGVQVADDKAKEALIITLKKEKLIGIGKDGQEIILTNNKPVNEFIRVGTKFDSKSWA